MTVRTRLAVLTFAIALAACGGEGTGPDGEDDFTFSATVSGDLPLSLSGRAVFGPPGGQGTDGLVIALVQGDAGTTDFDYIVIGRDDSAIPSTGVVPIVAADCQSCSASDWAGAFLLSRNNGDFGAFVSAGGGTLTLTSVNDAVIEGQFSFAATSQPPTNISASDITLQGTFRARRGAVPTPQ